MRRLSPLPAIAALVLVVQAHAAPAPTVKLWRLDCGSIRVDDLNEFSDTYAYTGRSKRLAASCYLIAHGDSYMVWDLGLPPEVRGQALTGKDAKDETFSASVVEQLARVGVTPQQVDKIGISHYHYDHTGQAADFPEATLLMGQADVQALRLPDNPQAKPLAHWLSGGGALDEVKGDKDVYGDGTVVMLDLPGHTPGHHGLLVRLAHRGVVLLTGDLAHFRENYDGNGVPPFNTDRSQTLASLARFKEIARNLHATVIIQHEEKDIGKLPRFPAYAD